VPGPIAISLFPGGKTDTSPQPYEFASWEAFCQWFTTVQATDLKKEEGRIGGWSPVVYKPGTSRAAENTVEITVMVLDLDEGDYSGIPERMAGLSWCIAPTYSHAPDGGKEKYRIAIQLVEPVPAADWKRVWGSISYMVGPVDKTCKDTSRLYYQPFAPTAQQGKTIQGEPLDWHSGLPERASECLDFEMVERATKILERAIKRVRNLEPGARDMEAYRESCKVGQVAHLLPGGRNKCASLLEEACLDMAEVMTGPEIHKCITRGLQWGEDHPRFSRESWNKGLAFNADQETVKPCLSNVLKAFYRHPDLEGTLWYNTRSQRIILAEPPPWDSSCKPGRAWEQKDDTCATGWLSDVSTPMHVGDGLIAAAAFAVSQDFKFDPFQEWLDALDPWDRVDRLQHVPAGIMKSQGGMDGVFFQKWLIGAIARTLEPGCKMDTTLVLVGPQGLRKSSFLRSLVPTSDLYLGRLPQGQDKDKLMAMAGPVIIEDGEMANYSQKQIGEVKAFLVEQTDNYRPPYGRVNMLHPRTCVFAGSTNETDFLHDATGNRRFWPIDIVARIDHEQLFPMREQLWAEALFRYRAGEPWWLDDEQETRARAVQEGHREITKEEEDLGRILASAESAKAFGVDASQIVDGQVVAVTATQAGAITGADSTRMHRTKRALKVLGFSRAQRIREGGGRHTWHHRPGVFFDGARWVVTQ